MGVKIIAFVIVVAFVLPALDAPHLFRTAPANAQGNKVSLPDAPYACVKTRCGWVCSEGGRDV